MYRVYTDTSVSNGQSYWYRIRADYEIMGIGLDVQATPLDGPTAISGLSASAISESTIILQWISLGPGFDIEGNFYRVQYEKDGVYPDDGIVVQGNGTAVRSYLYAADLVVWLLAILVRGENLEAYNVGSEKAMTISELANRLADYFSVPVSVQGSSGVVSRYVPATQKARLAFGLDEWTTLSTGLERMVGHVLGTSGIYRL